MACLVALTREGFIVDVVDHRGTSSGLGVYRKEVTEEEHNKYNANKCMTMHDMAKRDARCALTRYEVVPVKGGNIRESIPGVSRFWAKESKGESCEFDMLGVCGG